MFSVKSILMIFPVAVLMFLISATRNDVNVFPMEDVVNGNRSLEDAVFASRVVYQNDNGRKYSKEDIAAARKLNSRGYQLYRKKRDSEAISFYLKALKLYPMGETYYNLGNSLMNVHQYKKAEIAYLVALIYRPQNYLYNYNLACAYSLMGRTELSLVYLEKALALGYNAFRYIYRDPDMKNTRRSPSFQRIMDRYSSNRLTSSVVLRESYCEVSDGMELERFLFRSGGKLVIIREGAGPYVEHIEKSREEGTWTIRKGCLYFETMKTLPRPLYLKIDTHVCSY